MERVAHHGRCWTRRVRFFLALGAVAGGAPASAQEASVDVIDDRPGATSCQAPFALPPDTPDVNNQPQAEVWIDVSEDGRLAAAAKDYRFSPIDDTTYNNRVWNGLYLSDDGGASWRNLSFQDASPNTGLSGVTDGSYGRPAGLTLRLTQETDPALAFGRDGELYTCALAYNPGAPGVPSAIVVSRRDPQGRLVAGGIHLIAPEVDAGLFNDKNWIAVGRESPPERTVVVASWRLFSEGDDPAAPEGGWIAVSGDGARSFSAPIRLPVPAAEAADSQFYQPLIGRDPQDGRRTLYVLFRTVEPGTFALRMHALRADLEGVEGTDALEAHLGTASSWSWLPDRITPLFSYGANGYDGSFRFGSSFQPAVDRDTGQLYAVTHGFDAASQRSRVLIMRSDDGARSWTDPAVIDDPGRGYQLMPSVAARGGAVYAVWYDSRHDLQFAPLSPIRSVDVYAARLDASLSVQSVRRLTPESQRADRPAFTRSRPVGVTSRGRLAPHDLDPEPPAGAARASATAACPEDRYGFIGDYIGIAADASGAWAVWTDLREMTGESDACAGHDCAGNRNQSVRVLRLER